MFSCQKHILHMTDTQKKETPIFSGVSFFIFTQSQSGSFYPVQKHRYNMPLQAVPSHVPALLYKASAGFYISPEKHPPAKGGRFFSPPAQSRFLIKNISR